MNQIVAKLIRVGSHDEPSPYGGTYHYAGRDYWVVGGVAVEIVTVGIGVGHAAQGRAAVRGRGHDLGPVSLTVTEVDAVRVRISDGASYAIVHRGSVAAGPVGAAAL